MHVHFLVWELQANGDSDIHELVMNVFLIETLHATCFAHQRALDFFWRICSITWIWLPVLGNACILLWFSFQNLVRYNVCPNAPCRV